ncbi:hypothetical protein LSH36_874g01057 [Paralvinella palmiformis]|uniref:Ig-like domain-containing protein n=1 Tax=Paralvinella palmiformis TaxID=53620 RepID=A0AAD9IYB8_9ANNE|nr:hypothetical protein LSH36_874g01057 [Paralvinella palmiformis]
MADIGILTLLLIYGIITVIPSTLGLLVTPPQNTTATINNQTKFICRVDSPEKFFEWKEYVTTKVGQVIFSSPPGDGPHDPRYEIEDTYDLIIKSVQLADDIPTILSPDLIENRTTAISCSAHYGGSAPDKLSDIQRPTLHNFNYTAKISDEGRELRCEIKTNTPAASASVTTTVRVRCE